LAASLSYVSRQESELLLIAHYQQTPTLGAAVIVTGLSRSLKITAGSAWRLL
jgi:hypothetical protein